MVDKAVFCVDCVHYKEDANQRGKPLCMALYPVCFDLVTGRRVLHVSCEYCRSVEDRCSEAGLYYEPKRKPSGGREHDLGYRFGDKPGKSKVKVIAGRGDREVK